MFMIVFDNIVSHVALLPPEGHLIWLVSAGMQKRSASGQDPGTTLSVQDHCSVESDSVKAVHEADKLYIFSPQAF
jgi:hypothetical protein